MNSNTVFQSIFLNPDDNSDDFAKVVKRYAETRILASKINNSLIQLMK